MWVYPGSAQALHRHVVSWQVLRLYLQTGAVADHCQLEDQTYEAISQSMVLYEEQIADSRLQIQILTVIIGTLQSLKNISEANYDPLSTKACQYSSKLLKKPDQCQAAFMCSHLFWARDELKDGNKVCMCVCVCVTCIHTGRLWLSVPAEVCVCVWVGGWACS